MAFTERKRNRRGNKKEKIIAKFTLNVLINLNRYVISCSDYISEKNIANLKRLIDLIDEKHSYDQEEDSLLLEYFYLLKEMLKVWFEIDFDFDELPDIIRDRVDENTVSSNTIETIFCKDFEFSDKNALFWNKFIQDKLDYYSLFKELDNLQEVIDAFKIPDLKMDAEKIIPQARETITKIARQLATNKSSENSKMNRFDPLSNEAPTLIRTSLETTLNVGNKLSTGYKQLDRMLNGGFENGRCYVLTGIPKHFKSGTMLNLALNVACYSKNWIVKNPGFIPYVLYYTMENSLIETLERVYAYLGIPFDFEYEEITNERGFISKKYILTDEEIMAVLKRIKDETYNKTGICFMIEYESKRNITTNVFNEIYDDLLVEGKELIFIAQDYIKKIHSVQDAPDIRFEYGYIVDEFCNIAKERKIPFLTIHQFNREGVRNVEGLSDTKKKDHGRKLNASMIGDSNLVHENADYCLGVDREFDEDSQKTYQTFKMLAARGATDPNIEYMAQPFDPDPKYRDFRIAVDIDLPYSLHLDRISNLSDSEDVKTRDSSNEAIKNRKKGSVKSTMEIKNILTEDDEENERISKNLQGFIEDDEDDE